MSGFQDNDSEEPIGPDHVPVQPVITELQKLLESRGMSTSPPFSFSFPNFSGCTSSANAFKGNSLCYVDNVIMAMVCFSDSLVSVQDVFLLLLQSFSSSSQEVSSYACILLYTCMLNG